ncbi:MAG: hypothetical protein ACREH8_06890 [Opitutaceae bacterium]
MRKTVLTFALSVCLFLLIVAAKWAAFDRYGSPMPDWDQWDAEAVELFIPWFEKDNFVSHLFHPHNEHRVILTKLQNLALVLLNGQWDSRLEAVTNAMLHAALAVAFWVFGRRATAPRWHAPLFLAIAALFALPFAWQNILGGFHSQQYWLLVLSFVAIVIVPYARTWSASWWMGVLSAVLALGSMGSGLLASAVVIVVLAWRLFQHEISFRASWPTLMLMATTLAIGLATRVEVPWHQEMKAKSVSDYHYSIVHSLQWPLRDADWAAAVLWLPWLLVLWRVVIAPAMRGSENSELGAAAPPPRNVPNQREVAAPATKRAGQIIAALGGWAVVQVVATAYARGAGADYPASRYMDTLAFGTAANALALGWLLTIRTPSRTARFAGYAMGLAWLVTFAAGLRTVTQLTIEHELPGAKKYYLQAESHMRRYLATNDPRALAYPDIPFPSADGLVERLAKPGLRKLMPVPIRAPLPMASDGSPQSTAGFKENNAVQADWEHAPRDGLSPQTTPLDFTATWGSFDSADTAANTKQTWKSAPLAAPLGGWLKFETAGDLHAGSDGVRLALHDAATGAELARVRPSRRPGDTWRAAYVRAPRGPFIVSATDVSPGAWVAFSPPVEMGTFSYYAWQATRHARLVLYFAAAATVALSLLMWFDCRKNVTRQSPE